MKVRELLMKMVGVCSYGFYTRTGEVINAHPDVNEIMSFLDEDVDHFKVWIYDDKDVDIRGNEINVKRIRCCIYLERGNEDTFSDINPLSKGLYDDIACPYCGAKHFAVGYMMTTAMYCPTIIKDGKDVTVNRNHSTTHCTCCECHREFTLDENNKVSKIPGQENICVIDYSNHSLSEQK